MKIKSKDSQNQKFVLEKKKENLIMSIIKSQMLNKFKNLYEMLKNTGKHKISTFVQEEVNLNEHISNLEQTNKY